ncbi:MULTISPECIES: ribitol-5-phosphate dehydrogenase [Bacillaceae]|uniref:Ribulose-5-phosphate reductase n=1 Tax=Alkalicoccobacillus plakortidis TaxID=444060 RepID=A0A9D5DQY0_9BACI|nr:MULTISPECIES: ribitol-5-phosphate dehydrogenase [Bacillaceae]KQL57044.1 ribitol-5-phosphate dehydrogenase [Alkalicoccobacillus plakortidis]RQW21352.1 ribitol-5-phosphate dehydrogenase [Bacillus sp. C1-1]
MINQIYRLVSPGRFEITYRDMSLNGNKLVVRPKYLSVCAADQRYYQGRREASILQKKLPMALIHEGIGEVVFDPTNEFEIGQAVVMVPNTPTESDEVVEENYLPSSNFRSSGYDGFTQDYVFLNRDRVVPLFTELNNHTASFLELVSVSIHAIRRFKEKTHKRKETLGIWGDGNLGYITALLLRKMYPESTIVVFGKNDYKLDYFTFVDKKVLINDIPQDLNIDHAFECVGGRGSESAVDQIINCINPMGSVSLLGVSEEPIEVNTRLVLEKGLTLFGSSRSGTVDFQDAVNFLQQNKEVIDYLSQLVTNVIDVYSIKDIDSAFEEDLVSSWGKTVMEWKI